MDESQLKIQQDKVITILNDGLRWVVYRDEKSGHMVFGRFEELGMDEVEQALKILQTGKDTAL